MLPCPRCASDLSFWQLISARSHQTECKNCGARPRISGVMTANILDLVCWFFITLLTAAIPNLFLQLLLFTILLAGSFYMIVDACYKVRLANSREPT